MQELRTRLCSQMAEPPQLLHVLLRRSCSQMLAPPHSRQKSFSRVCGHFLRTAGIPHSALPLVSLRYQPAITALVFVFELHTSCARLGRSWCDHRRHVSITAVRLSRRAATPKARQQVSFWLSGTHIRCEASQQLTTTRLASGSHCWAACTNARSVRERFRDKSRINLTRVRGSTCTKTYLTLLLRRIPTI